MKKAFLGLFLSTVMMFAATTQLGDTNFSPIVPVFMFTNLGTPLDVRNNIVQGIYGWNIINETGNSCFVELFDSPAANVVLGTTPPVLIIPITQHNLSNFSIALPIRGYDINIQNHNLSIAAVTAPNGTLTCSTGIVGHVVITNN